MKMNHDNFKVGRILIVDDEAELMAALCEVLAGQGYETTGFTAGSDALKALSEQDFDVLLTDLMMPAMDGITLIKAGLEIDPNLLGIIMTGHGTVQTAVDAMKIGAFDYVLKPFKLNGLLPVLTRAMEVRRLKLDNVQLRETLAIHELGKVIAYTFDLNSILNKIADTVLQQCDADEVSIMLPTPDGKELYIAVTRGESLNRFVGMRVSMHQGIAGWVAQTHEHLILNGEVDDRRFTPINPRRDIHSAISIPMMAGGELMGVLNVNTTHSRRPFTLGQVKSLGILISIVAPVLQNEKLYAQIKQLERRYHSIFENSIEGIFQTTPSGRFITCNPALAGILGYDSPEELMTSVDDIGGQLYFSKETRKALISIIEKEGRIKDFETQMYKRNGTVTWVSENIYSVKDPHGNLMYYEGTIEDITERKSIQTRGELGCDVLEMLNHAKIATDSILDILILIRNHMDMEAVGIRLREGEDYPYYQANGFSEDFLQAERYLCARDEEGKIIHDSTGSPALECMCGNIICGRTNPALPFFTETGSFWTNSTTDMLASTTDEDRQARARNRCNSEGYESVALIPLRLSDKIIGLLQLNDRRRNRFTMEMIRFLEGLGASIGIALDRMKTEGALLKHHKELEAAHNELKKAQAHVIQQEKMAAIGQLAAGITHEINNPMSFITGNLGILQTYIDGVTETIKMQEEIIKDHAPPEAIRALQALRKKMKVDYILKDIGHLIDQSLEGADRVGKIVSDLKTFSRKDDDVYMIEDINAALDSTINIVQNEIKYKAELVKETGKLPLTRCNISHLNQVFMNLLVNAAQAIEKWGKITVRTWTEGDDIYVSVSDTGSGIPEEIREQIFEPFFTTKAAGKGTGLGLSISYDIMKRHNGGLTVESKVGEGTTFTVRIPILRS